jgi:hypothetical protein
MAAEGDAVNRRRIDMQIRAVLVTYRVERRRRDAPTMDAFRDRARALLNELEEEIQPYPDLAARLREARRELESE